jgi:hypothetical protein
MRRTTLLYALSGLLVAATAHAIPSGTAATYNAALPGELTALSGAITGPLVDSLAFATASQEFAPPGAKPTLGFNIGVGFGLSLNNIDKAAALAAGASSNSAPTAVDLGLMASSLPSTIPVGLGSVNAHLGLPLGFDLGLRYDNLNTGLGANQIDLTGYSADIRHNLLTEGLVTPVTLAIGASYSRLYGNVHAQSDDYAVSGTYDNATLGGTTHSTLDVDTDISSYSLRATVSRSLIFVTPYLGASADAYSGGTKVTAAQVGHVTVNGTPVDGTLSGSASQIAPSYDLRGAAGLKFNLVWLYAELGAEYGFISGIAGGHAQVGVDFR